MSAMSPRMPKFKAIAPVGASRQMVEISLSHVKNFFPLFWDPKFCSLPESKTIQRIFTLFDLLDVNPRLLPSQRDKTTKCPVIRFYPPLANSSPKRGVNRRFQVKLDVETHMCSKHQRRFQPNIAQRQRPPSTVRRWSKHAHHKSKMTESAAILENLKIAIGYLSNGLTDRHEIRHHGACWA